MIERLIATAHQTHIAGRGAGIGLPCAQAVYAHFVDHAVEPVTAARSIGRGLLHAAFLGIAHTDRAHAVERGAVDGNTAGACAGAALALLRAEIAVIALSAVVAGNGDAVVGVFIANAD